MASSTSPKKDAYEDEAYKEYELNLELWKHYDNLRQDKSKTFLTAQTILIALSGFVLKSQELSPVLSRVVLAVTVLGLVSSVLWVLLLYRNKGYIDFHRKQVRELEGRTAMPFTTFSEEWPKWKPTIRPRRVESNTMDLALACVFALFWLCLCVGVIFLIFS
jgi:hypothetical protein